MCAGRGEYSDTVLTLGSVRLMIGLDDLKGIFQPKRFCDSMTPCQVSATEGKTVFPPCWANLAVLGSGSPVWWVRMGLSKPGISRGPL